MTYNLYQGAPTKGLNKLGLLVASIAAAILLSAGMMASVFADATGAKSNFGDATTGADGVHLFSDSTHSYGYSGVDFALTSGTVVNDLTNLEATFTKVAGNCGGGSARYEVDTASGNIFVYVGDAPNFTNCADGSTGNLLTTADLRVDTTQVAGGTFYDTWAHAKSLIGSAPITSLSFVVDSGWMAPQEFVLSAAHVNGVSYNFVQPAAPTNKDQCKNGGYAAFGFKNQGLCVASVQSSQNSKFNR